MILLIHRDYTGRMWGTYKIVVVSAFLVIYVGYKLLSNNDVFLEISMDWCVSVKTLFLKEEGDMFQLSLKMSPQEEA